MRELDLNQRPLGYEPNELPDCSIPQRIEALYALKCELASELEIKTKLSTFNIQFL